MVDTGVETTQPDLAGQLTGNAGERGAGRETNGVDDDANGKVDDWLGWDFVYGDNIVDTQGNFHGTHVSGTVAALKDNCDRGRGRRARGQGRAAEDLRRPGNAGVLLDHRQAFDYAGDIGADVVNASLGGLGTSQLVRTPSHAHPNTLYVVSAGNSNDDAALYMPCNTPWRTSSASAPATTGTCARASPTTARPRSTCSPRARTSARPTSAATTPSPAGRRWPRRTSPARRRCWCPPSRARPSPSCDRRCWAQSTSRARWAGWR